MTLREALIAVDLEKVFPILHKKDGDEISIKQTIHSYTKVVQELLGKPRTCAYKMSWLVQESFDPVDNVKYADVCFLNPNYVAPKKGLKPWGCRSGVKKAPKGYYNVNDDKHSRTFASGFTKWSKIIDTPIINDAKYSLQRMVAAILWELTFYGWSEEGVSVITKEIMGDIKEAMKEIKKGKCIELPPEKKGGFKIVIPDMVSKQIVDIANNDKKRK